MSKVQEFWIKTPIGTGGDVLTVELKTERDRCYQEDGYDHAPMDKYIHVVDYASFAELSALYNQEIPFLEAYQDHFKELLADRKERDALARELAECKKERFDTHCRLKVAEKLLRDRLGVENIDPHFYADMKEGLEAELKTAEELKTLTADNQRLKRAVERAINTLRKFHKKTYASGTVLNECYTALKEIDEMLGGEK